MTEVVNSNYVSKAKLAKLLHVSPPTIQRWINMGKIHPVVKYPSGRCLYDYEAVAASIQVPPEPEAPDGQDVAVSPEGKDADAE